MPVASNQSLPASMHISSCRLAFYVIDGWTQDLSRRKATTFQMSAELNRKRASMEMNVVCFRRGIGEWRSQKVANRCRAAALSRHDHCEFGKALDS